MAMVTEGITGIPIIGEATYLEGSLADMLSRNAGRELRSKLYDMPPEEAAVLALLYQRFQRDRRLVRV